MDTKRPGSLAGYLGDELPHLEINISPLLRCQVQITKRTKLKIRAWTWTRSGRTVDVRLRRSVWFGGSVVLSLWCEPESPAGLVKL